MQEEKGEEKVDEKKKKVKEGVRKYSKLTVWVESQKKLMEFVEKLNAQSKRSFNFNEVLSHALSKIGDLDITVLQEEYYTAKNRFHLLLDKENKSGTNISEDALLAKLIEGYESSKKSKGTKAQRELIQS